MHLTTERRSTPDTDFASVPRTAVGRRNASAEQRTVSVPNFCDAAENASFDGLWRDAAAAARAGAARRARDRRARAVEPARQRMLSGRIERSPRAARPRRGVQHRQRRDAGRDVCQRNWASRRRGGCGCSRIVGKSRRPSPGGAACIRRGYGSTARHSARRMRCPTCGCRPAHRSPVARFSLGPHTGRASGAGKRRAGAREP